MDSYKTLSAQTTAYEKKALIYMHFMRPFYFPQTFAEIEKLLATATSFIQTRVLVLNVFCEWLRVMNVVNTRI